MNWFFNVLDPARISAVAMPLHGELRNPAFWLAVGKIIWIDILLSGDNALVIALACRGLQPKLRLWGMAIGAGVAVILLIGFTAIVSTLMALPFLKLAGGLALIIIAARLLLPEGEEAKVTAGSSLWQAIRIIVIADIVMSLDNVIAVAAAANGEIPLLILGLAISIPVVISGAALIMALLDRLPILIWIGAALLGWIAGHTIATDPAVQPVFSRLLEGEISFAIPSVHALKNLTDLTFRQPLSEFVCGVLSTLAVLILGTMLRKQKAAEHAQSEINPAHTP